MSRHERVWRLFTSVHVLGLETDLICLAGRLSRYLHVCDFNHQSYTTPSWNTELQLIL